MLFNFRKKILKILYFKYSITIMDMNGFEALNVCYSSRLFFVIYGRNRNTKRVLQSQTELII
jgi:hypothetical protein